MQWKHASNIEEIPAIDLYQILKLRQDIFIIEQQCNYDDIDNIDPKSEHIYLKSDEQIIAYARIVPAGIKFKHPSIGRVVVKKSHRSNGLGKEIMRRSINVLDERGIRKVMVEAQSHLQSFYESLGFVKISEPYNVDDIMHIKMSRHIFG